MTLTLFLEKLAEIGRETNTIRGGFVIPGLSFGSSWNWIKGRTTPQPGKLSSVATATSQLFNEKWSPAQRNAFTNLLRDTNLPIGGNTIITPALIREVLVTLGRVSTSGAALAQATAIRTVHDFYSAIRREEFLAAWKLLTENFQQSNWGGDYAVFKRNYQGLRRIEALNVFPINEPSNDTVDVGAFFYEVWNLSQIPPPLRELTRLKISDLDEFVERIKKIRRLLVESGVAAETVDSLELFKLFFSNCCGYLRFRLNLTPNQARRILGSLDLIRIPQLMKARCLYHRNKWRLGSINWIRVGQLESDYDLR